MKRLIFKTKMNETLSITLNDFSCNRTLKLGFMLKAKKAVPEETMKKISTYILNSIVEEERDKWLNRVDLKQQQNRSAREFNKILDKIQEEINGNF